MIRVSIILLSLGLIIFQFPSNFMKKIFFPSIHSTSCAHLTNYELYSSSLFMSVYEEKKVHKGKNLNFIL